MTTIAMNVALMLYFVVVLFFAVKKGPHVLHMGAALLSVPVAISLGVNGDYGVMAMVLSVGLAALFWSAPPKNKAMRP